MNPRNVQTLFAIRIQWQKRRRLLPIGFPWSRGCELYFKVYHNKEINLACPFVQENCESEMLRRDCDDDSPRDEIEYWKTRSTRLNLIQQQFNSPQVALVVQCLNVNRSKLMKRWVEALRKLTHCCHEANNNTLYLSDFENHCKTLYVWDPVNNFLFI